MTIIAHSAGVEHAPQPNNPQSPDTPPPRPAIGEAPPFASNLDAALYAARLGFPVIQLLPDGVPAAPDWCELATSDQTAVREQWAKAPDREVGTALGDGLIVVMVVGSDGAAQLGAVGELPDTAAYSEHGDVFLFFRLPQGVRATAGRVAPNVAAIATGYIGLPSADRGGHWIHKQVPPALAPASLIARLTQTNGVDEMGAGADAVSIRNGHLPAVQGPAIAAAEAVNDDNSERAPVPPYDTAAAIEFLLALNPNGRHDLAYAYPNSTPVCATFLPTERAEMEEWIEARQGKGMNLYTAVNGAHDNVRHSKRLNHARDKDIGWIRATAGDLDPPKIPEGDPSGEHFRSSREKLPPIARQLAADPDCPPSFIVDSGGGLQAWYLLDKPLPATPDNVDLVEGIGRAIKQKFGAAFPEFKPDGVFDVVRLMRIPGTINYPDERKRKQGRGPAAARVLYELSSKRRYSTEQLTAWAPPISAPPSSSSEKGLLPVDMKLVQSAASYSDLPEELRDKFESAWEKNPSLRNLWSGHIAPWQKDPSGSGFSLALAWGLKRDGRFTHMEFGRLLYVWDYGYESGKIDARRISRDWDRAKPPIETASGLEVVSIGPRRVEIAPGATTSGGDAETESDAEAKSVAADGGAQPDSDTAEPEGDGFAEPPPKPKRPKLFYLTVEQCEARLSEPRPRHLIEGLIPARAMVVTYGESSQGKSFHVMDRYMHVAGDMSWCGCAVSRGAVVWVAAELSGDLEARIIAAKQKLGLDSSVPFFPVPCPVDLLHADGDTKPLIALVKEIEAERGIKVVAVVIDTLSRAIAGGNENSSDDMGALVRHLDAIRYQCECTVEVIHHSGKDTSKGARGHSLLRAATDTEIEIGGGQIYLSKQRTDEANKRWDFRLHPRRVGLDHEGREIVSCYVETRPAGSRGSDDWRLPLSAEQQGWLDALSAEAPKGKEGFPIDTAMTIWGVARTTAGDRLSTLYGTGYLEKPKGRGRWALLAPNRQVGRQDFSAKQSQTVKAPSDTDENTSENSDLES